MTNSTSIKFRGTANLWIAEKTGKPSNDPGLLDGINAKPNKKCPKLLHNKWITADGYKTWHPAWDPCVWWWVYH